MGPGFIIATVACAALLFTALPSFKRMNKFPLEGRTAIVTGGSQGLGLSVAKLLATKGAHVVIVAQDVAKLERAVQEISGSAMASSSGSSPRIHHLSFDLRDPKSAPEIFRLVTAWNSDTAPEIVFNCAGHCIPGFFSSSSVDTLRAQMDTIYWSAAYMAHAALDLWTTSATAPPPRTRHIIFTSSTLAFFPIAGYAPYSPAKAAMKALADTLNQEVAIYNGALAKAYSESKPKPESDENPTNESPSDIKIHTLYPMGILTPGYENENKLKPHLTMQLEKDDVPQPPDVVARIAIERLERGEQSITTMFLGHVLRGVGMGASPRAGVMDVVWNIMGSVMILFVAPDFLGKCWKWGKDKGAGY